MALLEVDELQANAILEMQLRRLAALERQKIIDEYEDLMVKIADFKAILESEDRQRQIISEELAATVEKYGDERRTQIVPWDGEVSMEDLIAEQDVVVTITRGGYAKRTNADLYRSQRRGGKGIRGASLRQDDIVEHFFVTTTHHWILFFTNKGRVYRTKAYELPDSGRDARGMHVANLLAFQPDETIAQVMYLRDYEVAPYLVLATRQGQIKKTALTEYDSPRQGGVIAINLREDDEVIGALLVAPTDDVLLVSRRAMSIRFTADDDALRPMGRATGGVRAMALRQGDSVLSLALVREGSDLVVATANGYVKRTDVAEYRIQGRGGYGTQAAKTTDDRGELVGALAVVEGEQLFAITSNGGVIRTVITSTELRRTGRATMGVRLINVADGDSVVAIARNAEASDDEDSETDPEGSGEDIPSDSDQVATDLGGGAGGGAAEEE